KGVTRRRCLFYPMDDLLRAQERVSHRNRQQKVLKVRLARREEGKRPLIGSLTLLKGILADRFVFVKWFVDRADAAARRRKDGPKVEKITVVIAEDERLTRDALARLLALEDDIDVLGQAAHGEAALRLVHEQTPDVLLTDINMPGMDGIALTRRVKQEMPHV